MIPPIEPKNSPGLRANVRVAYPTLTFTVISSGCPQPASSSHLGDSDPRPLASTTRSAPSVSWTVPPFDRTTRPVTRPVPVSNAGFTPSVPSRKVTLGSVLTLRRIAASRHGRLTVMPPEARIVAQLPPAVLEPEEVADDVAPRGSERLELVHHARDILVHRPVAAGQQAVRMVGLRNALARLVALRQRVALHQRDAREVTAQGAGRQQPAHAGSEDDRGRITLRHSPTLYP